MIDNVKKIASIFGDIRTIILTLIIVSVSAIAIVEWMQLSKINKDNIALQKEIDKEHFDRIIRNETEIEKIRNALSSNTQKLSDVKSELLNNNNSIKFKVDRVETRLDSHISAVKKSLGHFIDRIDKEELNRKNHRDWVSSQLISISKECNNG